MKKDLMGNVALVTGASSGLGEQYAKQLAARGADLIVAARRADRLEALARELRSAHGVNVQVVQCDLSHANAPKQLFDAATAGGREVTILINNAGAGPFMEFVNAPTTKHVDTIQLNVTSLTELCHRFSRHMLDHKKPSFITNVGSIASYQACPNFAVYSSTKAFVKTLSEVMAFELKGTNVSVMCLCPGGTVTEFSDANGQVLNKSADKLMMSAEEVVRQGIDGMFAHKTIVIPGFINKFACHFPRFVPSSVALCAAHMTMSRSVRPTITHRQD